MILGPACAKSFLMSFIAKGFSILLVIIGPLSAKLDRYEFVEKHMGTDFKIVLYCKDEKSALEASAAAFAELARLDAILSDYNADSELSRLSKTSGTGRIVN